METIKFGKYVELAYEIFAVDKGGENSVFKFTAEHPDGFVFGMDQSMLEEFANRINNLEQGAEFDFTLTPDEAFGPKNPDMVLELDKSVFNVNGEFDAEKVREGVMLPMLTQDGHRVDGLVTKVGPDTVIMDFNHQLAGSSVRYKGKVITVRDATPDEVNPKQHACSGHCGGCDGGCGGDEGCSGSCDSCGK